MKINIFKLTLLIYFILNFYNLNALENKILAKVNNEIITTVDIFNEIKYLSIINENFKNLEKEKAYEISKSSLIREKIKEIELKKNFRNIEIDDQNLNKIIDKYSKNIGFSSYGEFQQYIQSNNLNLNTIKNKIKIEALWNQLIIKKFLKDVKIDQEKIRSELNKNIFQTEYLLYEIVFNVESKENLNDKIETIKKDIKIKGFENAALIHSISNSANKGGELGWIKKSSLNSKILLQIEKSEIGKLTEPITIPGGFLILKIKSKRNSKEKLNVDKTLKLIIDEKTNEQLNRFSIIYFNKIKKDIQINET